MSTAKWQNIAGSKKIFNFPSISKDVLDLGNLIMVRDVFRERLSLISTADKGLIFYLLDDLILLHSDLLEGLTTTKNKDIGKVFLLHMSRITYLVKLTTCFNEFSGYEFTNFL